MEHWLFLYQWAEMQCLDGVVFCCWVKFLTLIRIFFTFLHCFEGEGHTDKPLERYSKIQHLLYIHYFKILCETLLAALILQNSAIKSWTETKATTKLTSIRTLWFLRILGTAFLLIFFRFFFIFSSSSSSFLLSFSFVLFPRWLRLPEVPRLQAGRGEHEVEDFSEAVDGNARPKHFTPLGQSLLRRQEEHMDGSHKTENTLRRRGTYIERIKWLTRKVFTSAW